MEEYLKDNTGLVPAGKQVLGDHQRFELCDSCHSTHCSLLAISQNSGWLFWIEFFVHYTFAGQQPRAHIQAHCRQVSLPAFHRLVSLFGQYLEIHSPQSDVIAFCLDRWEWKRPSQQKARGNKSRFGFQAISPQRSYFALLYLSDNSFRHHDKTKPSMEGFPVFVELHSQIESDLVQCT